MDENKEFEKKVEETEEKIQETVEKAYEEVSEAAENIAEKAEEIVEEAAEKTEEFAEKAEEIVEEGVQDAQEYVNEVFEPEKKKTSAASIIAAVIVLLIAAFCVLLGMGKIPQIYNKYNHMGYVNVTGRTIADIAEDADMELSELLEQYDFPKDMPANTQESAAYYMMPVKSIARMYGMTFDDMKELLGFGDDITEDTEWGVAEGEVTLEKYIGEDNLDEFKEKYGFGDEITLETKWKEVRKTVDLTSKKEYEEEKAAEATEEHDDGEETSAETEVEETEEAE